MSEKESKRGEERPCIRCGKCVNGCPMGLESTLLCTLSQLQRWEDCEKNGIMNWFGLMKSRQRICSHIVNWLKAKQRWAMLTYENCICCDNQ